MKSSQKKAGKPKLSKFQLKQKSKQQSKNVLARRNAKFYDQVVDYFPRDGDGEGMVFNKAPVIKENIRSKDKSVDKGKRPREKTRVKGTGTIYQDYNSDEDDDEGLIKKVKGDDFADDDDFGEGLLGMTRGFADYFVNNKNSFKSLSKMSQFDYDEGSLVLTCIYDKGPNEKYMVVNLSRNKKGYVSFTDVGRGEENLISKFQIGEYVLALTMASNNKKVQFSLKPEHINREMRFENIQNNQIISGYLRDKEDYGYTIDFCTEDRTTGFLYTPEVEGLEFALDRPYLFIITGKNETTNLLNCQIIHPALSFNAEPLDYQEITRQNEEGGLDLQRLTDAGNLVQCIVKKKLENGLLVSFLGIFYGFIFQDHLAKPLEEYKNNEKIRARIIATNFEAKKIHLSELDAHINLQIYRPDAPVGTKVSQATVKETLYGGSYFLEVNTSTQKPGKKATKMEESYTPAKAFLHKTHAILDEEGDEESKEEPKLAVEDPITKPVFVKEYNYFEHYLIVSMRDDVQSLLKGSWSNIKGGDFLTGTISKITEGGRQLVKVIVNISQGVSGVVNYTHLSDLPSKASLKGLKEKKEVRVRVLNVDTQNKKLYLTMKPSLLSEDAQILTNFLDIQHGVGYQGVISGSTEKGFLVEFFNGIKGFLPYNDIENNGSSKDAFVFGQTVKVFVKFNDVSNQKIGLTLSGKSSRNIKATEEKWNNIENQNKKIATALKNSVAEGDVYKYKILRKKSAANETFLFAKSVEGVLLEKGNYVEHIAILPKTHCSDFESHNERLFEFYKLNDFTFQAKVLSFLPNDNVLISGKPSLLKQPLPASMEAVTEKHHYYGYVDSFTETGVRVKLSEHTKGFISSAKLPESIQANFSEHFTADKTLQVRVTKATPEQNKLYLELSQHKEGNLEDAHCFFLDYLDEEFLVASEEVKKNQQRWAQYKIGNYVEATIKLVKEYGIIVTLNDGMAGLILKSNLLKEGGEYKTGQKLVCRVLDVDYDKSVVDLCEEKLEHTKFVNKYKKRMDYNREKVNKYALWKLKKETLSATVLLVKDLYIVGKLVKYPKVIVLIQCKNFNEFHIPHEVYEQHSTVKFRSLNLDIFHPKNASQVTEVDNLKKSSNAVIGEIFVSGKKEKEDKPTEKESAQSDMKLKQKLKEGAKVVGEITKIDRNNVFVALSKSIFGRVHKTQFDFDPISKTSSFSNFKVGDEITCKIISIRKTDRLYIDLTAQTAQLELPEEELNPSDFILQSIDETYKGKKYPAVVKNVSAQNMSPLYLELSNNIYAHVSLFEGVIDPSSGQAVSQLDTLRTVQENYKPGDVIEVWVKKVKKSAATGEGEKDKYFVEVTLYDCSSKGTSESKSQVALEGAQKKAAHKIGDQVLCKVVQILPKRVRVQFGKNEFGFVDITELFDEFYAYPLKKIEEKRNLVLPGRIIGFSTNEGGHKSRKPEIFISLRESVLNPENWLAISPEGTTIQFKKKLGYQEEQGDLRNRIYKFGPSGLKENMIVVGYVSQTNEKGCFVRLGLNVVARSSLKELVEGELANPTVTYFSNRLVICRVLAVREDGKVDITLKEKGVKYGYNLDDNKLKVGLIVKGEVVDHLKNAALVAVPGCKYNGLLRAEEVNTEGQSIQKAYPVGAPILAKIKHIEKTDKSVQFKLTCRIEESELEDTTNIFNLVDEKSKELDRVSLLYDSIQETCKEYNNLGTSSAINKDLLSNINAQNEAGREGRSMEVEEAQEEEGAGNAGFEEEVAEEEEFANEPRSSAMIDFGDEDEQEENEGDEDEDDIREEQSVMSEEEDIEENIDFLLSNKSANKKRREIQKMKLEAEIREREKKLLDDNEKELKSSDDYEKLLLRNPNSSYIWIQYAAFKYQKDGIEKARQILERALRTITFRNEDEKLNLWTAYINLEYNFGTEDTLMKLFERAKATNNPKQVFIKLLDLYKRDQKWDLVEELSKVMIKKHKNSSKAWVRHLEDNIDIMKNKNVPNIDVSGIVSRALQSLPKRKHLKILSHHGMLLFKAGEQEKGRTVFEAIVTNYPKRTDIWSIYADMETKHGDKESFRNLMERCLTMSLNPKKMKFFFKRYLQYETKIGNPDRIEYVRQKAREYVEKQMNEEENGNANENEEADEKLE